MASKLVYRPYQFIQPLKLALYYKDRRVITEFKAGQVVYVLEYEEKELGRPTSPNVQLRDGGEIRGDDVLRIDWQLYEDSL